MKLGIMQPYFFPYIGYFQLMNAVDTYVIYDDVNYIKQGWINRNRILNNGNVMYFNLPVIGASSNRLINELKINMDYRILCKNLRTIQMNYSKAPYYNSVYPIIEKIMTYKEDDLVLFLKNSFEVICDYLGINTKFILSSQIKKDNSLKGQDKVLEICKIMGAKEYYNAIGGQELYDYNKFREQDIRLAFVKSNLREYKQFGNEFVPGLSIIDVMMFNSVEQIKVMLNDFSFIEE